MRKDEAIAVAKAVSTADGACSVCQLKIGELWAAYPMGTPATFDGTSLRIFRGLMPDAAIGQIRGFAIAGAPVRVMECVEMTGDTLTFREVGDG